MIEDEKTQLQLYIMIKNLLDGNLYSSKEIATLLDVDVAYVSEVMCGQYDEIYKDILSSDDIVSDGSGVIYYLDIKFDTIVDGIGFRNSIYCAKCDRFCKNCHNPQSWNIFNGKPISINSAAEILLENGNNITFTGGECSLQANAFTRLAKILKANNRTIWLYSGYTFEELIKKPTVTKLLHQIDVLVDGQYIDELNTLALPFRGSENQRIVDVQKSFAVGKVINYV